MIRFSLVVVLSLFYGLAFAQGRQSISDTGTFDYLPTFRHAMNFVAAPGRVALIHDNGKRLDVFSADGDTILIYADPDSLNLSDLHITGKEITVTAIRGENDLLLSSFDLEGNVIASRLNVGVSYIPVGDGADFYASKSPMDIAPLLFDTSGTQRPAPGYRMYSGQTWQLRSANDSILVAVADTIAYRLKLPELSALDTMVVPQPTDLYFAVSEDGGTFAFASHRRLYVSAFDGDYVSEPIAQPSTNGVTIPWKLAMSLDGRQLICFYTAYLDPAVWVFQRQGPAYVQVDSIPVTLDEPSTWYTFEDPVVSDRWLAFNYFKRNTDPVIYRAFVMNLTQIGEARKTIVLPGKVVTIDGDRALVVEVHEPTPGRCHMGWVSLASRGESEK